MVGIIMKTPTDITGKHFFVNAKFGMENPFKLINL